jgi:membrane fusion protein (multidrug efflux system)
MLSLSAKRRFLGVFFGSLTLILLLSLVNLYFSALERRQRAEEERAGLLPPAALRHTVEIETIAEKRRFSARLEPWRMASLAPEIEGRVKARLVDLGDPVEAGQILLKMDATLAELNLKTAQKNLLARQRQQEESARQLREGEALLATRSLPLSVVESRRSQLAIDEAEVARMVIEVTRAEELVRRHELQAPFPGSIAKRSIEEGDRAGPGQVVFELVDLTALRLVLHVGEREWPAFSRGMDLNFSLAGTGGKIYQATVTHLSPARSTQGNYRVEARFDNLNAGWPGGRQVTVEVPMVIYENIPFIPAAAVRFDGPRTTVLREMEDGEKPQRFEITVGPETDGRYPVLSGLNAGDILIIR